MSNKWPSLFLLFVGLWSYANAQSFFSEDTLLSRIKKYPLPDSNRVNILNQLATATYNRDPVVSLKYAFEAKEIADSIGYTKGTAEAFRGIGLAFLSQSDISTAISYYLAGLKIAEEYKHSQVIADITGNLGLAYNKLGEPNKALEFLNQSLALQKKLKNDWRQGAILNNIGDSYLALKKYNEALDAYNLSLKLFKKTNQSLGIVTDIRNIGNVFEAKQEYDSAIARYFSCIALSSKINDTQGITLSNLSIASIYLKTNKIDKAKKHALIGLNLAKEKKLRSSIRDLNELLYKISEAEGNLSQSFYYYKQFILYKDSIQNLKVLSNIEGQRFRFEIEKKETEIGILKKDAELHEQILSAKNYQLLSSVIILILSFLLLVLFIRYYFKLKAINKVLLAKNTEIDLQSREISNKNNELIALNEEILAHQEKVTTQRDALEIKNQEIATANEQIKAVNENLEKIVTERTSLLQKQNEKLSEYAFLNAHKLRSPLASILGLTNLMMTDLSEEERKQTLIHLKYSSNQLDEVVHSISSILDNTSNSAEN